MVILEKNDKEIWIQLPSGEKTVISKEDSWILEEFPVFCISGSRSKYVIAERPVKTKYSTLRERIYLHKLIVKCIGAEMVDHIDRDRLNNRRENLRRCTRFENMANVGPRGSAKYKGVHKQKRKLKKQYVAYIDLRARGGKRKYLGHFENAEDAARAYDKESRAANGEYAYLNFPEEK